MSPPLLQDVAIIRAGQDLAKYVTELNQLASPPLFGVAYGGLGPEIRLYLSSRTERLPPNLITRHRRWRDFPVVVLVQHGFGFEPYDAEDRVGEGCPAVLDASVEADRIARAWPELTAFAHAALSTGAEMLARGGIERACRWLSHLTLIDADKPMMRRRDPVPEVAAKKVHLLGGCKTARHRGFVEGLRRRGFEVSGVEPQYHHALWTDIDPSNADMSMDPWRFTRALRHPLAVKTFGSAVRDLREADAAVLLLPAGEGAHLELGYAVARGHKTVVLLEPSHLEPVLPYKLAGLVTDDTDEVERFLFGTRSPGKGSAS